MEDRTARRQRARLRGLSWNVLPLDATPSEVRGLRSFIDGMIMIPDVRRHLHKSWGLCPRHAWLEAVVESEATDPTPWDGAAL